jgi:hypothetical protein
MDTIRTGGPGLTVEAYAAHKLFSVSTLARWGVMTVPNPFSGEPAVALPYRDLAGDLVRTKYRTPTGTIWDAQRGISPVLYGLWWLHRVSADRPVLLVEGESDCHAAWHRGVLALGLPGSLNWRSEWAEHFGGRPVYIWREPDTGGTRMVARLGLDVPTAKVIQPHGVKDLAELHTRAGAEFNRELRALLDEAVSIGQVASPSRAPHPDFRVWRAPMRFSLSLFDQHRLVVEQAREMPIEQLMRREGFELVRRGREWAMCCPFHDDQRPSLRLNVEKGTWYCDVCGVGGDSIEFMMRWQGLAFTEAVRQVAG